MRPLKTLKKLYDEESHIIITEKGSPPRVMFYGEDFWVEDLPVGTRVICPRPPLEGVPNLKAAIRYAINHPEGMEPLHALLSPGMKVTIALDDISLPLPPMKTPDVRQLPLFAAFDLLKDDAGTELLRSYYETYVALAREREAGFVLESPTWRASPRWAGELGYDEAQLDVLNRKAIALMEDVRGAFAGDGAPIVISGCIGPQDDGYNPQTKLTAAAAQAYHQTQISTFAGTAADMVTAITMTYADEATGITRAAGEVGMPVAISFTVETDGRLPSGQPLGEAIEQVDAETGAAPAYFMINCAHPTHFDEILVADAPWLRRIGGLRANASTKSHAELDEATELDDGDPADLADRYASLKTRLPQVSVLGGCCGTDHRHVAAIRDAWLAA